MRALVTGATGLVGKHLLGKIENPVVLSRNPDEARRRLGNVEAHAWNPESGPAPGAASMSSSILPASRFPSAGPTRRSAKFATAASSALATSSARSRLWRAAQE